MAIRKIEKIICSAIWYKHLPDTIYSPVNIDQGMVVCGHRHGNIIEIVKRLSELRTVTYALDATGEFIQGFLTNTNRFVDRKEGWDIAEKANQINDRVRGSDRTLYSEDIY